jgi:ribulose-phosphate 3-epimerase
MKNSLIIYKYRFLFGYIVIGIFSLIVEFLFYNFLNKFTEYEIFKSLSSLMLGILFSFWCNVRYNFKISKAKRDRALVYFIIISFSSYLLQILIINKYTSYFSYEILRTFTSGSLFWVAYLFHRYYSFKDFKKVGVAIYANGFEDINSLYKKVEQYPDFIHVDIVDESFNKNSQKVLTYKTEVIKGYWNNKIIEAHIMSRYPKKWILDIIENVNRIFIHIDIDENLEDTLKLIKSKKCESGIVIQKEDEIKIFEKYNNLIDSILILSIENPGYSGQVFNYKSLDIISKINQHKYRYKTSLVVDGGINNKTISLVNSENVISGSYVLNSESPIKNICILQTSSQYESI